MVFVVEWKPPMGAEYWLPAAPKEGKNYRYQTNITADNESY